MTKFLPLLMVTRAQDGAISSFDGFSFWSTSYLFTLIRLANAWVLAHI